MPPLFSLPVQALHAYDCLLTEQSRNEGEECWTQTLIVHDIAAGEQNVHGTEKSVNEGIKVFESECGQPHQSHPIVVF